MGQRCPTRRTPTPKFTAACNGGRQRRRPPMSPGRVNPHARRDPRRLPGRGVSILTSLLPRSRGLTQALRVAIVAGGSSLQPRRVTPHGRHPRRLRPVPLGRSRWLRLSELPIADATATAMTSGGPSSGEGAEMQAHVARV